MSAAALAQEVPPAGLAAEAAGRWDEAVDVYRRAIDSNPRRSDLWQRISTIESRLDRPDPALQAMDAALAIEPQNVEYLRADAVLATWVGDYAHAATRYRSIESLRKSDADALLGLARVTAWSGATDEAVGAYHRYLRARPDALEAWLELSRAESWRGNYPAALRALGSYRSLGGNAPTYRRELAQLLTHAGKPTPALALIDPLLAADPNALDLLAARAVAFAEQDRPRESFDALDLVRRKDAGAREARDATEVVRVLLGSTIAPTASFYSDSDRLRVQRYTPSGSFLFASGTRVSAGYEHTLLDAPAASGLGRLDGATAVFDERWLEARQTLGMVTLGARVGASSADDRTATPYDVSVGVRASDSLRATVDRASDFLVISPRTIELGLTTRRTRATIEWAPGLRAHVSAQAIVDEISDGNTRWEVTATPRTAVARTERWNVDVGAAWYLLTTSARLTDGYYDPRRYENYGAALFPYWKISEGAGLSLSLVAGVQRDEPASPFRFGGNAGAEATLGIYRPWVLSVRATATNNRRSETGAFHGYGASVGLTRRF